MPDRRRVEQGWRRTSVPAGNSNLNSKSTTSLLNSYRSPQLYQAVDGTRDITEEAIAVHGIITAAKFDLPNLTYSELNRIFLFLVEATMTSLSKPFLPARPRQMKNIFTSWTLYWQKRNETEVDPALRVAASSCKFSQRFPEVCTKLETIVRMLAEFDRNSVVSTGIPPIPHIVAFQAQQFLNHTPTTMSVVYSGFLAITKFSGCRGGVEVHGVNSQVLVGPRNESVMSWRIQRINFYKCTKNQHIQGDMTMAKQVDIAVTCPFGIDALQLLRDTSKNPNHRIALLNQWKSKNSALETADGDCFHPHAISATVSANMTCELVKMTGTAMATNRFSKYDVTQVFPQGLQYLMKNQHTENGGVVKTKLANTSFRKLLCDVFSKAKVPMVYSNVWQGRAIPVGSQHWYLAYTDEIMLCLSLIVLGVMPTFDLMRIPAMPPYAQLVVVLSNMRFNQYGALIPLDLYSAQYGMAKQLQLKQDRPQRERIMSFKKAHTDDVHFDMAATQPQIEGLDVVGGDGEDEVSFRDVVAMGGSGCGGGECELDQDSEWDGGVAEDSDVAQILSAYSEPPVPLPAPRLADKAMVPAHSSAIAVEPCAVEAPSFSGTRSNTPAAADTDMELQVSRLLARIVALEHANEVRELQAKLTTELPTRVQSCEGNVNKLERAGINAYHRVSAVFKYGTNLQKRTKEAFDRVDSCCKELASAVNAVEESAGGGNIAQVVALVEERAHDSRRHVEGTKANFKRDCTVLDERCDTICKTMNEGFNSCMQRFEDNDDEHSKHRDHLCALAGTLQKLKAPKKRKQQSKKRPPLAAIQPPPVTLSPGKHVQAFVEKSAGAFEELQYNMLVPGDY